MVGHRSQSRFVGSRTWSRSCPGSRAYRRCRNGSYCGLASLTQAARPERGRRRQCARRIHGTSRPAGRRRAIPRPSMRGCASARAGGMRAGGQEGAIPTLGAEPIHQLNRRRATVRTKRSALRMRFSLAGVPTSRISFSHIVLAGLAAVVTPSSTNSQVNVQTFNASASARGGHLAHCDWRDIPHFDADQTIVIQRAARRVAGSALLVGIGSRGTHHVIELGCARGLTQHRALLLPMPMFFPIRPAGPSRHLPPSVGDTAPPASSTIFRLSQTAWRRRRC